MLIVDDSEGVFESLEMNFQREGRPCLWAANREQAVRIARDNDLYAAIIDLSLGSEDGLDAMLRILEGDRVQKVIVSFASSKVGLFRDGILVFMKKDARRCRLSAFPNTVSDCPA